MRRTLALTAVVAALVATTPGVASAHLLKGQYANNYATAVTSVVPTLPGLTATATSDGASVSIAYTGSETVVVYGYFHEPYLRITPAGVDENENSPSVDLNQSQNIGDLGDGSGISKAAAWKHVSSLRVATWHDHRVHWMDNNPPPVAQKDPGVNHLIKTWKLDLSVGSTPVVVNGTLTWLAFTPGSRAPLFVGLAVALVVMSGAVVLVRRHRRRPAATQDPAPVASP
jgi:hypothetical protein